MRLKRKSFSGYSEVSPQGIGYQSAQVTTDYLLDPDPAEKALVYIENSPIGKIDSIKTKTNRFVRLIRPVKSYIKYKIKKKEKYDSKKK